MDGSGRNSRGQGAGRCEHDEGTSKNLLRVSIAALGGARNPHVLSVRSGFCAPSALPSNRS